MVELTTVKEDSMRTYYNDQPEDLDLSQIVAHRLVLKGIELVCLRGIDLPKWFYYRQSEAFAIHRSRP